MVKKSHFGRDYDADRDVVSTQSAPVLVDAPYIEQTGSKLTCTMGNWEGEPTSYSYAWTLDGAEVGTDSSSLTVTLEDVGKSAACQLTATNAEGSLYADSNTIVVEDQGFEAPPVNMDEPKTYVVVEDGTKVEVDGEETVYNKGDEVQVSITNARRAIAQGARIIGID